VPRLDDDYPGGSSLVLADSIEKVTTRSIGAGQFVIGESKVRPRVDGVFRQDEKLWVFMQVYHLGAAGKVRYQIVRKQTGVVEVDQTEPLARAPAHWFNVDESAVPPPPQLTLEKGYPLRNLGPGDYTARVVVADSDGKTLLSREAPFTVR